MALVFTTSEVRAVKDGLLPEIRSQGLHAAQEVFLEVADPAELVGEGAVIPSEGGPVWPLVQVLVLHIRRVYLDDAAWRKTVALRPFGRCRNRTKSACPGTPGAWITQPGSFIRWP